MAVVIWADRWEAMAEFYAALLEVSVPAAAADFAHLRGKADEVLLHRMPAEFTSEPGSAAVVLSEAPVKPLIKVLSLSGATAALGLVGEPFEFNGSRYLDAVDPDGNVIALRADV